MTGESVVPNRIFVGGLPANANLDELQKYFCKIGEVIGARVVDIKIKMDVRGCSEGYGFVTFEEEKHVKKLLNLDKEKFKFQDKMLNIQQAFYTARRRPYGSTSRDKSRGYRPRMEHGSNNDADDYYQLSPGSGLVSPNTAKSSENDGSELSKIYAQSDDNNNNVFSGSEANDEPSSSSAILSSSTKASEANVTQSSTSTNSLPFSNDVAGGKSEPTESGGEWADHKSGEKGDAKLDALNPRQLLESMRNQSNKNTSSGGGGGSRPSFFNPQGHHGNNSNRNRYNGDGGRPGRNGSFSNNYRGGDMNFRSNSASKSRPPNGAGANQNQYYRSNSISSGSKNHFRNLTVDTRGNNQQFNKKLFSPLTYLASRNAASLNQPQSSPYSNNNNNNNNHSSNNNMSNPALGYYYAMAAAAAAANAGSTSAVMSPHGSAAMMSNYKGVNPNGKHYQPNFKQGHRPSLQLDNFSSTCYAGSVLNNNAANENNMYTTIVNSANNNVGSEQASITHFLNQADMHGQTCTDYNNPNQSYTQNPVTYYHGAQMTSHPANQQPQQQQPTGMSAQANPCGYTFNRLNPPNSNQMISAIKENASSYDMNQQQQQAQIGHESRLSSVSKSSLANEMSSSAGGVNTTTGAFQPRQPSNPSAGEVQAGESLNGNDANVDRVQEMMAKSLNLNENNNNNNNNAGQAYSQLTQAQENVDSSLTKPYFVRPPVPQYATTYQQMSPLNGPKPTTTQFQSNLPQPPMHHQYVYCYNALPSHMIQQQSRIITSGPLSAGSVTPVQMHSPMHQQVPANIPAHLSAPMSVVFASNQHMAAYSMAAMSPQQQVQLANYNSQMSQAGPNYSQPGGQPLTVQLASPSGAPMTYLSPNPNYHPAAAMYQAQQYQQAPQPHQQPVYFNSGVNSNMPYYSHPHAPSSGLSLPTTQQAQQQQQLVNPSYSENQNSQPASTYQTNDSYRYQDQQQPQPSADTSAYSYSNAAPTMASSTTTLHSATQPSYSSSDKGRNN